ncbi:MAG: alcohol dehydrogenase catalytic domain-containing protein [Propionibacteriaceae bacterium]|nr:alcohol dehydrogenase catalytic domain-containing protein [Propionibacteriaceae bacterium]
MRAAVLNAPGELELMTRDVPDPGPGEILLRVEATTLCGTDVRLFTGEKTAGVRPEVTLGHEVAGRIAAVGEGVRNVAVGEQAVVSIVVSCHACRACLADREHMCANLELIGYAIDGGLADYLLVPARAVAGGNVVTTNHPVPPTHLALAEPVSCCLNGLDQYRVTAGDTVVILGAGPIGLIHTALARLHGATRIIVANRGEARREAAVRVGATHTLDPRGVDLVAAVGELTDGAGADVVVVCIGATELAGRALELAAVGGRVSYFAGFPKGATAGIDPNLIHYRELTVTGGSNARRRDVVRAVRLLESGALPADEIVTHTFALADVHDALEAVANKVGIKIAVVP